MATVFDVAQRAGVSPTTVSRVLLGRNIVTPEKRARVLEAAEALGYQPNAMAQGLRLGRGRSVALLVGDIEQNVYSALTKHVQAELESVGLDVLLFNLGHREDRLRRLLDRAIALRMHGICIATSDVIPLRELKPIIRELTANNTRVIALNQRLEAPDIACVTHDNVAGAMMATQYLLRRGYAPVVYLGRVNSAVGRERYLGYQAGLAAAGIDVNPDLVWQTDQRYRYEAGYEAMSRALDRGLGMRSVFAGSDELALGAMAATLDRGLKVPQDIALVGVGGIPWGAHVRPSLTTIAGDWPAMAKAVREIFVAAGEGKRIPRRTIIEAKLVERQSSSAAP